MFFHRKKQAPRREFDREKLEPVIRCSICTGEEVAGFRDRQTGHFTEVQLLRTEADLEQFQKEYGVENLRRIY